MTERRRRSVYLDEGQWQALAEIAKAEDRSVNGVVRLAVGAFLMRHSDWATYETLPNGEHRLVEEHPAEPLGPRGES